MQAFFWDGRAPSLEAQIDGPIDSKDEMDADWSIITYRLSQDLSYRKTFQALYGGLISEATIKDAIVEYERSLNTPGCRFDQFLSGDASALNAEELQGLSGSSGSAARPAIRVCCLARMSSRNSACTALQQKCRLDGSRPLCGHGHGLRQIRLQGAVA